MEENIIGRNREKQQLRDIYESDRSEFLAIYGRRRVGKTFLIRQFFENSIVFQTSGMANTGMKEQIKHFYQDICRYDKRNETRSKQPADWQDVFFLLNDYIESLPEGRKVIFLDELPWMDTPGSQFISALEAFWNGWMSNRNDVVLIVCGSATSWMMDNLIRNHGGLYGRLTRRIFLNPFTLGEVEIFLTKKGFSLSRYEIAEYYMIMGGIPYYLQFLNPRYSLTQNIDQLLFQPNGELYDEFSMLYAALFRNSGDYIKVVEALSQKGYGMTRKEISEETNLKSGSVLSQTLSNLEDCGFIRKYENFDHPSQNSIYQLVDFFTLFYFRFLSQSSTHHIMHWEAIHKNGQYYAWAGFSFELLALQHIDQIKDALRISGVFSNNYSWRNEKAQIDLIINREDNTVNICEMKFTENQYTIDGDYANRLKNKIDTFKTYSKLKNKSVQLTMVTTYGIVPNSHSNIIQNEVTLNDFFTELRYQ